MKKLILMLKVVIALVLAFSMSFNFGIDKAWATGEFQRSCENIQIAHNDEYKPESIVTPILSANCQKMNGSFEQTSINLNPYIGNNDGSLSWESRNNFGLSCYDLEINDAGELKGMCLSDTKRDAQGKFVSVGDKEVSIDLNDHIANIDGTLKYE